MKKKGALTEQRKGCSSDQTAGFLKMMILLLFGSYRNNLIYSWRSRKTFQTLKEKLQVEGMNQSGHVCYSLLDWILFIPCCRDTTLVIADPLQLVVNGKSPTPCRDEEAFVETTMDSWDVPHRSYQQEVPEKHHPYKLLVDKWRRYHGHLQVV